MVDSNTSEKATDPDSNFYGKIEDHSRTAQVESILIGGKYEKIVVYQEVIKNSEISNEAIDPKQNKILINLKDIKSIALQYPENPMASSIKVNNKNYIKIIIESINGIKKYFLVESTRKLTCREMETGTDITENHVYQVRDLSFMHIKKLTIIGYKSDKRLHQSESIEPTRRTFEQSSTTKDEKNKLKADTENLIYTIEQNVRNLPIDNPTALATMKETILTLLKSLRDQLQKFLDMVK